MEKILCLNAIRKLIYCAKEVFIRANLSSLVLVGRVLRLESNLKAINKELFVSANYCLIHLKEMHQLLSVTLGVTLMLLKQYVLMEKSFSSQLRF